jgi:fatty acid desaturase
MGVIATQIRTLAAAHGAAILRTAFGWAGLALVIAGVWGLWGWQWAAILGGLPVAGFYIYGEIRAVRAPQEETD